MNSDNVFHLHLYNFEVKFLHVQLFPFFPEMGNDLLFM